VIQRGTEILLDRQHRLVFVEFNVTDARERQGTCLRDLMPDAADSAVPGTRDGASGPPSLGDYGALSR